MPKLIQCEYSVRKSVFNYLVDFDAIHPGSYQYGWMKCTDFDQYSLVEKVGERSIVHISRPPAPTPGKKTTVFFDLDDIKYGSVPLMIRINVHVLCFTISVYLDLAVIDAQTWSD